MELTDFIAIIRKNQKTFFLIVFVFALASAVLTFVRPLEYSAKVRLLAIEDFGATRPDPYAVAKSNESLGGLFAGIITSGAFLEETLRSDFNIDRAYFKGAAGARQSQWQKMVEARAVADTGIIEVKIYHTDRNQAEALAQAVAFTLKNKHRLYHPASQDVNVKTLDQPVVSRWPERPNAALNVSLGLGLGIIFALLYLYTVNLPAGKAEAMEEKFPEIAPVLASVPATEEPIEAGEIAPQEAAFSGASANFSPAMLADEANGQNGWEEFTNQGDIRNILGSEMDEE